MRLIIAIPTTGRAAIAAATVRAIARQTRLPDQVWISVAQDGDITLGDLSGLTFGLRILHGPKGGTEQRNRMLEALEPGDIALFLDDDFVMAPDYLAQLEELFCAHPDVVLATGRVLADGIHGPGYSHAQARRIAEAAPPCPGVPLRTIYNGYGCNMAVRADPVVFHGCRFDPRLVLYSWLEDVDFSRQLAAYGRIVHAPALQGVHLGTKTGRSSGTRLGYSQVANPLYLMRKGTMAPWRALRMIARNLAANLAKSMFPEPEIDRAGRLRGNLRAFGDLAAGRIAPERVQEFE